MTPIFALDTACSRRRPRNAVISRGQYLKPGADLYMNDEVGGNQRRARFEALCQSLRPDLLRFAFWLSRDRALAEDVVQESMLRAWNARDSLLNEAAAKPWLLTIVRREFARLFERKRFATVDIDELVAREEPTLAAADEQDIGEMRAALFRLPDEYREPLALQVLMGYSTAEIARELNLSSAAVLTRLFRARRQLRAACGENTAEDPRE
jgi:RNA polymerase sigma-70 factor, ECF subfamily